MATRISPANVSLASATETDRSLSGQKCVSISRFAPAAVAVAEVENDAHAVVFDEETAARPAGLRVGTAATEYDESASHATTLRKGHLSTLLALVVRRITGGRFAACPTPRARRVNCHKPHG